MSKQIDLENVSDEDLRYLADRPWLVREAAARGTDLTDRIAKLDSPDERTPVDVQELNTRTDPTPTQQNPATFPENTGSGDEEGDDYDQWKVDELRTELKNRNLSTDGNKSELIARLREDDSSEDGAGTEG